MKTALVALANGFEEIEAISIIDILRRARIHVVAAGVGGRTLIGSRRTAVVADRSIEEVAADEFDLVCLPGGATGAAQLAESAVLADILRKQNEAGRLIGAICAAPTVLERHGLLEGKKFTCHYTVRDRVESGEHSGERVVQDGNIVTSQGAGTALEFALHLAGALVGEEQATRIAQAIMAVPGKEEIAS